MVSTTKVYPNADAKVTMTLFKNAVEVGGVYSVTKMPNGYTYINSIYYPFHYEVTDAIVDINDQNIVTNIYNTDV